MDSIFLSESRRASTHNLTLAHELSVEFGAIERKVDIEVDAIEGALWCVHALEVLFEVLATKVGGESNDFFYA